MAGSQNLFSMPTTLSLNTLVPFFSGALHCCRSFEMVFTSKEPYDLDLGLLMRIVLNFASSRGNYMIKSISGIGGKPGESLTPLMW